MIFEYKKNQPITNFLYTDPVNVDVSHIYKSNYEMNPADYIEYINQSYKYIENVSPVEGNVEEIFGQKAEWKFLRVMDDDIKPTWANFGVTAKFMMNFAYCDISVAEDGVYNFELSSASAVCVRINGENVFEKREFRRVGSDDCVFEAKLQKGKNSFLIMMMTAQLHCTNSISLVIRDCEFEISLPLKPVENRFEIEKDFKKLYISGNVIKNGADVTLISDEALLVDGEYVLSITDGEKVVAKETFVAKNGEKAQFTVCNTNILENGVKYVLNVDFCKDGIMICGSEFDFEKITCVDVPKGLNFKERKDWFKSLYLTLDKSPQVYSHYFGVYGALVSLLNGKKPDENLIFHSIDFINKRTDCSDFCMHGLILVVKQFADKLSQKCLDKAKECILNFKYNEEDGGNSMMFCRSENHSMLFATLEHITGLMYPDEIFTQSGKNGKFHSERGRILAEKWIDEKLAYGFTEWHSNTYYEEDMISLLNILEFSDGEIAIKAKALLDVICMLFACHNSHGILATTHGRAYESHTMYPVTEPVGHLTWLLTNVSDEIQLRLSTGVVVMLCNAYVPPIETETIASAFPLATKSRMGYFKNCEGAPCLFFRDKDYSISSLLDYRYCGYGQQTHSGQVLIGNDLPVFVTSFENASKNTRPSYWGGQYRNPKTVSTSHSLVYLYNIETKVGYSHCYFPIPMFDECRVDGNRIFGKKGDVYVCVYNPDGFSITDYGIYKNCELMSNQKYVAWAIEVGTGESYGSFETFILKSKDTKSVLDKEGFTYQSPDGTVICLEHEGEYTVNGGKISIDKLIENEFVNIPYGK